MAGGVAAAGIGQAALLWPRSAGAAEPQLVPRLRIVIPANEGGGWDQTGRRLRWRE